jgi:trimethylamine--corrinoid protein Co-methyltransferase
MTSHDESVAPSVRGAAAPDARYRPLSDADLVRIHEATLRVLDETGIRCADERAAAAFRRAGCAVDGDVVHISEDAIAAALETARSEIRMCGREPEQDLLLGSGRVYLGTGGAALDVIDPETGETRRGRLSDVARIALLVDNLEHIDFYLRPTEPQDIPAEIVDVNKYYAGLANTTRHVMAGINTPEGLQDVFEMASVIAGGDKALVERPFISVICCWIVSPLTIDPHSTGLLLDTLELGLPVVLSSAPMAGATSPMTLAGTLVQINAELLSGIVLTQAAAPGAPVIYGAVPSLANLRDGSYLAGAPEYGLMNAAAVQLAHHYGVPIYNSAGLTDSKASDIQTGYEKAFSIAQSTLAGADFVHHAAGMLESMATISYEQYVIDNEILGMAKRMAGGIDMSVLDASVEAIARTGPGGNYLMDDLTLERMRTEAYQPTLSNRDSRRDWEQADPPGLDPDVDAAIRERFPIEC